MASKYVVNVGDVFGRLTVLELLTIDNRPWAKCVCECGETRSVRVLSLARGDSRSCGNHGPKRIAKLRDWHLQEKKQMDKTAAIQHFLTTYRVGGESADV